MNYFTDFNVSKESKIGITNVLSNITQKLDSHKGGWTKILRCQLLSEGYADVIILNKDCKFSDYDVIIFDLGAEFQKVINIFGGLGPQYFERIQDLLSIRGQVFSRQHSVPCLREVIQSRLGKASTFAGFGDLTEEQLAQLHSVTFEAAVFDHVAKKDHLLFGDSHTPGVWTPDMVIERRDGRTLAGALEHGTIGKKFEGYTDITVHISSIDIRHHIARSENPGDDLVKLVLELEKQLIQTGARTKTICHTMGIENESRKLPKTGFFKGTAFYGDWYKRQFLRDLFNKAVNGVASRNGWNVIAYPDYFFNEKDELDFTAMETPKSVHISPAHYRWNVDFNQLRWGASAESNPTVNGNL